MGGAARSEHGHLPAVPGHTPHDRSPESGQGRRSRPRRHHFRATGGPGRVGHQAGSRGKGHGLDAARTRRCARPDRLRPVRGPSRLLLPQADLLARVRRSSGPRPIFGPVPRQSRHRGVTSKSCAPWPSSGRPARSVLRHWTWSGGIRISSAWLGWAPRGPAISCSSGRSANSCRPSWPSPTPRPRTSSRRTSGRPFRGWSRDELARASVKEALAHPTWQMGPKITIDSATLMNKGLEVIEAHYLFRLEYNHIDVVVHPESIIHGIAEFTDGSMIAEMAAADMRLPIQLALAFPDRLGTGIRGLDLAALGRMSFEHLDREAYPAVDLAYRAGRLGLTSPAALNAAGEVRPNRPAL